MSKPPGIHDLQDLLTAFAHYTQARRALLELLGRPGSCRDPLAEFSEVLVAHLLGGSLAASRVQKGFDLIRPNGRRVQVKYLANPQGTSWRNEHRIDFRNCDCEDYALVIFEDFTPQAVLVFPRETVGQVTRLLKKRHAHLEATLQFTKRNYQAILAASSEFAELGVEVYRLL